MSDLKKGDLVMTDMGLAWYDRIDGEHLVNPVSWEKDHLSPHFTATKATRIDVEAYLKEKGYLSNEKGSYKYSSKTNKYFIHSYNNQSWEVDLDSALDSRDFDTAPAMQAEAILMAKLLNATKD